MNSKQVIKKDFVLDNTNGKCTSMVVAIAEKNKFRVYVAWENELSALQGWMGFCKSTKLYDSVTKQAIDETMRFGLDIGHTEEHKIIFKALYTKPKEI